MGKRTLFSVLGIFLVMLFTACGGGGGSDPSPPPLPPPGATLQNIAVWPEDATIKIGGTQPFKATGTYSDGKDYVITTLVTWSSSNKWYATVNDTGRASAVGVGVATIKASLDGKSGTASLTVTLDITPGGSEGSFADPVRLYVDQTHTGKVGSFPSYYYFWANAAGKYSISLADTTSNLGWNLYNTPAHNSLVSSCNDNKNTGGERCIVTLEATTFYYLDVINWSFDSAVFNVTVSEGIGEGSVSTPVDLSRGTRKVDIAASSSNYYKFTPDASGSYSISVSGELGIGVYNTPDFITGPVKSCAAEWDGTVCTLNGLTANEPYYIEVVEGVGTDTVFDMTVKAGISEGSTAKPVNLLVGDLPHAGAADAYGSSYYIFNTPASGTGSYDVILANIPDPNGWNYGQYVWIYVYEDFAASPVKSCTASSGGCTVSGLNENTPYYVEIRNHDTYYSYPVVDITYDISVTAGQCVGSVGAPVPLALGAEFSGNMDVGCTSYFTFDTAESGSYDVSIANTPGYEYWYVYSGAAFSNEVDFWYNSAPSTVTTTNFNDTQPYYLKIENHSFNAGDLKFTITKGASEGSASEPVALLVNAPHAGSVSAWDSSAWNGYSYYTFTPPVDGDYAVILNNSFNVSAMLWDQPGFSTFDEIAYWSSSTYMYSKLNGLVGGTPYYYRVRNGTSLQDQSYTVEFVRLDPLAGCSAGALECLDFDDGVIPAVINASAGSGNPWSIESGTGVNGSSSMKSGTAPYPGNSCFEYTPSIETWQFRVSLATSGTGGYFRFYVDGAEVDMWFGTNPWERTVVTTAPGFHTYKMCYSSSSGTSTFVARVDDIEVH